MSDKNPHENIFFQILYTAHEASGYLKINSGDKDGLKKSRSTGELWGFPAPVFIKAKRKVIYQKSALDAFLAQLPRYQNNAQIMGAV